MQVDHKEILFIIKIKLRGEKAEKNFHGLIYIAALKKYIFFIVIGYKAEIKKYFHSCLARLVEELFYGLPKELHAGPDIATNMFCICLSEHETYV